MKQLYFVRHGLSEMNKKGVFAGHTDTPLAEEGHEQAKKAGKQARAKNLSFDVIVSSPLQRAHHTARHIAAHTEYPHENIILDDRFKERNYGVLEGAKAKSLLGARYYLDESIIDNQQDVESLEDLQNRANEALKFLQSLDHDIVLVVAHGAFGRALYRAVNNLPITKRDVRYANAEIIRFL